MKKTSIYIKFFAVICTCLYLATGTASAQVAETDLLLQQSDRYLSGRIRSMERLHRKTEKMYRRLLSRMGTPSENIDSLLDSVAAPHTQTVQQRQIDSLKAICAFASAHAGDDSAAQSRLSVLSCSIKTLEQQVGRDQRLQQLVNRSLDELSAGGASGKVAGFRKDLSIIRSQLAYYRNIYEDPDAAEALALEYLQGTRGFGQQLVRRDPNVRSMADLHSGMSADQMAAMGFQTKEQVKQQMSGAPGGDQDFAALEQMIAAQLQAFQSSGNPVLEQAGRIRQYAGQLSEGVKEVKNGYATIRDQGRNIQNIDFRNPMRGIPFWHRFEPGYNLQTIRPGLDNRPAMLHLSASALFRQTPRLSYGAGLSGSLGLGNGWRDIRFSFEGIGLQAIIDYRVMGGISIQGVYERLWGSNYLQQQQLAKDADISSFFGTGRHSLYAGIFNRTKIGRNRTATFFMGYDFLWKEQLNQSPFVIKVGFGK